MEYFKDNDFFEKMGKVAVPKLDAARTSGYYTAYKSTTINNGMKVIVNAVQTEAMKYTYSTIAASKTTVESNLLATLQDTFQTECITSVIVSVVVQ